MRLPQLKNWFQFFFSVKLSKFFHFHAVSEWFPRFSVFSANFRFFQHFQSHVCLIFWILDILPCFCHFWACSGQILAKNQKITYFGPFRPPKWPQTSKHQKSKEQVLFVFLKASLLSMGQMEKSSIVLQKEVCNENLRLQINTLLLKGFHQLPLKANL